MFEYILNHRKRVAENIAKSFGEEIDIEKARSGVYKDTAENRKLGRVGQRYGSKKEEEKPTGDKTRKKSDNEGERDLGKWDYDSSEGGYFLENTSLGFPKGEAFVQKEYNKYVTYISDDSGDDYSSKSFSNKKAAFKFAVSEMKRLNYGKKNSLNEGSEKKNKINKLPKITESNPHPLEKEEFNDLSPDMKKKYFISSTNKDFKKEMKYLTNTNKKYYALYPEEEQRDEAEVREKAEARFKRKYDYSM